MLDTFDTMHLIEIMQCILLVFLLHTQLSPFSDSSGPVWFSRITYHELLPRKTTIAPENQWLEDGFPMELVSF